MSFLPLGRRKHSKPSGVASEKPTYPLRWNLTRGRGDEAQRLVRSWQNSLETQVEAGALEEEPTWESIAGVMREVAEQVVERVPHAVSPCVQKRSLGEQKWSG